MKKILIAASAIVLGSPAFAAGIDSRAYTCGELHALIAARRFVYIGIPFQGFAVSGADVCSGDERLEPRGVATRDDPQCTIPYCEARPGGFGGS
ncbi:MAG: hypothetical protein AB7H71_05585 [Alphaproteobacteria bacterium]